MQPDQGRVAPKLTKSGGHLKYNMSAGRKEEKHEKIFIPAVGNSSGFYFMRLQLRQR